MALAPAISDAPRHRTTSDGSALRMGDREVGMRTLWLALGISAAIAAMPLAVPAQAQNTGATAQQERMKSCNAEAKTQNLRGDARKSFMSDCLKGNTAAANPAPSGTTQPSARSGTTQPPSTGRTTPPAGKATATTLAAGQFASESEARRHCPGDQVVWANTKSHIYHYAGAKNYGNTKEGAYMCQQDSERAGYRAAKNEKPPAGTQSSR
jgi:hypothetical protein